MTGVYKYKVRIRNLEGYFSSLSYNIKFLISLQFTKLVKTCSVVYEVKDI